MEATGEPIEMKHIYAYDTCMLFALTLIETGADDPDTFKNTIPLVASRYKGICGPISFDKYGDRHSALYDIYYVIEENI